jgi:hypothetical protein
VQKLNTQAPVIRAMSPRISREPALKRDALKIARCDSRWNGVGREAGTIMHSKKVVDDRAGIARRTRADTSLQHKSRPESTKRWGPAVGPFNGLGPALVEIYDAGAEHPIDLLDQVVSIIRRQNRPDERMRDIAVLMRDWQQPRRD